MRKKLFFKRKRQKTTHLFTMPFDKKRVGTIHELSLLIRRNPSYGDIVCRCEMVSVKEIKDAIKRGARTLDGIKFRTRAQAGRCHGGFCTMRIAKIMAQELGVPITEVTKKGNGSEIILGERSHCERSEAIPKTMGLLRRSPRRPPRNDDNKGNKMIKSLTCIECPKGCRISVDLDGDKINSITGFQCKKGEAYAKEEVIDSKRILTSSVLTEGLEIKMLPVRTSKPIPKSRLMEAMEEIKKIRVANPVKVGDIVKKDFVVPGIDLLATREAFLASCGAIAVGAA